MALGVIHIDCSWNVHVQVEKSLFISRKHVMQNSRFQCFRIYMCFQSASPLHKFHFRKLIQCFVVCQEKNNVSLNALFHTSTNCYITADLNNGCMSPPIKPQPSSLEKEKKTICWGWELLLSVPNIVVSLHHFYSRLRLWYRCWLWGQTQDHADQESRNTWGQVQEQDRPCHHVEQFEPSNTSKQQPEENGHVLYDV